MKSSLLTIKGADCETKPTQLTPSHMKQERKVTDCGNEDQKGANQRFPSKLLDDFDVGRTLRVRTFFYVCGMRTALGHHRQRRPQRFEPIRSGIHPTAVEL